MPDEPSTKIEHLKIRIDGLHDGSRLKLRLHRAVSWLRRGNGERDADAKYIFLWIAFNAAYAVERNVSTDAQRRESYLNSLVPLDKKSRIYRLLATQLRAPVQNIMENVYLYRGFWDSLTDHDFNWQEWSNRIWFERDCAFVKERLAYRPPSGSLQAQLRPNALIPTDVAGILHKLFDRLNVLRNQLMHGCATQHGTLNRRQVDAGAKLLGPLVHLFLEIMVDNAGGRLGCACIPGAPRHPGGSPPNQPVRYTGTAAHRRFPILIHRC